MSNQSGISVSESLAREFPDFVSSSDIAAVLAIDHAKEHVSLERRISGSLDDVRNHLGEGTEARYIALKIAEEDGEPLAFIQFMPDMAPLSSKMKYASSHATIHRQLGGSSTFGTTIFWTDLDEVSAKGLKAHRDHEDAPAPLTEEEASLATAKEYETASGSRGVSVAGQSTLAIHANLSSDAKELLQSQKPNSALVLKVRRDESETIELDSKKELEELASHLQDVEDPRYVVCSIDGKTVFAFVCPRSASIKERMLFASTRISFLEYLKTLREVHSLIETSEPGNDLQVDKIRDEIAPNEALPSETANQTSLGSSKPKFQRPRPPKRR